MKMKKTSPRTANRRVGSMPVSKKYDWYRDVTGKFVKDKPPELTENQIIFKVIERILFYEYERKGPVTSRWIRGIIYHFVQRSWTGRQEQQVIARIVKRVNNHLPASRVKYFHDRKSLDVQRQSSND